MLLRSSHLCNSQWCGCDFWLYRPLAVMSRCLWGDYLHPMWFTFLSFPNFETPGQELDALSQHANPNQPEMSQNLKLIYIYNPVIIVITKTIQNYPKLSAKSGTNHPTKSAKPANIFNSWESSNSPCWRLPRLVILLRCRSAFDALNITVRWVYRWASRR